MKKFLVYIIKVFAIVILSLFILDVCYTVAYLQCKNRGKIDQVYNFENKKFDVIILGSSRANNHFVAQMFEDKGLTAFNYGMSGSSLFETSLMLKLMIERKCVIKNVILDADFNLASDYHSEGIASRFLPYIYSSEVTKKHFEGLSNFQEIYWIPFYRYMKYETIIGFREMFFSGIHKRTINLDNKGYLKLEDNQHGNLQFDMSAIQPLKENKYYIEIKNICKENNINFIPVMTPICENAIGMDYFNKVKKAYPEIYNYENAVVENKYFSSCGHMNDSGAKLLTAKIIKDFFDKKRN